MWIKHESMITDFKQQIANLKNEQMVEINKVWNLHQEELISQNKSKEETGSRLKDAEYEIMNLRSTLNGVWNDLNLKE